MVTFSLALRSCELFQRLYDWGLASFMSTWQGAQLTHNKVNKKIEQTIKGLRVKKNKKRPTQCLHVICHQ